MSRRPKAKATKQRNVHMNDEQMPAFNEIIQALQKGGIDVIENDNSTLTAYCTNGDVVRLTLKIA